MQETKRALFFCSRWQILFAEHSSLRPSTVFGFAIDRSPALDCAFSVWIASSARTGSDERRQGHRNEWLRWRLPFNSRHSARCDLLFALLVFGLLGLGVIYVLPWWMLALLVITGIVIGLITYVPRWLLRRNSPAFSRKERCGAYESEVCWQRSASQRSPSSPWPSGSPQAQRHCRSRRSRMERRRSSSRDAACRFRGLLQVRRIRSREGADRRLHPVL